MEKISIIVPIYNSEKTIERCIESLISQKYSNLEIILVIDGSTDASIEICKKYINKDNRIKLIEQNNCGVSSARNNALRYATGKYICFVDSDDIVYADMCKKLLNNILDTKADLSVCNYSKKINTNKLIIKIKEINRESALYQIYTKKSFAGYVWNKMYKREIIIKYDIKFDEKIYIGEDTLFNIKYILNSKKIVVTNEVLYNYVHNKSSVMNQKFDTKWLSILEMYKILFEIAETNQNNCRNIKSSILIGFINANFTLKKKLNDRKIDYKRKIMEKVNENINNTFNMIIRDRRISRYDKLKLFLKKIILYYF